MNLFRAFHHLGLPFSVLVYLTGMLCGDVTLMFIAVLFLFCVNVIYAICEFYQRFIFLFFHLGLFLFLLSRPTIALFKGISIQSLSSWHDSAVFAVTALFLSLVCLNLGAKIVDWLRERKAGSRQTCAFPQPCHTATGSKDTRNNSKLPSLRITSAVLFFIGFIALMYLGMIRLELMAGRPYEDYYLIDTSAYVNIVVRTFASMEPFALCAYLATFPRKGRATLMLLLHVLTALPVLMIGGRGDFVLSALFAILYYVIRDYTDGKGTWIGRLEKTVLAIGIPTGLVLMGMMSYIRAHAQMAEGTIFDPLINALWGQGVSYGILSWGYDAYGQIDNFGFKGYSFGSITDYVLHGPFGVYILGNESLPAGNGILRAVQGHSYAHAMSYFEHWGYLQGRGYGSSYLLELNQDFGYLGIAVFSLFFGMLLRYLTHLFKRSWFWGTVTLTISTLVFHVPRGATDEWIFFIITPQFWCAILLMVAGAAMLRAKRPQAFLTKLVSLYQKTVISTQVRSVFTVRTGETNEHSDLRGLAWHDQAKNRSHSGDRHPLRWVGAGTRLTH